MHTLLRRTRALIAIGAATLVASCGSLDVTNPNAPDRSRALAQSADVVSLVGGAFYNWYFSMQYYTPAVATGVMASHVTMSWGNFGARKYSSVPRVPFNNVSTDSDIDVVNTPWYGNYGALVSANLAMGQVADPAVFGPGKEADAAMVKAAAQFIQGATLSNVSLYFDRGFVVDETTDATGIDFSTREQIRDAALTKLDAAIASAGAAQFTLPSTFLNHPGWTSAQLAQVANFVAARTLAYYPRTRADMGAVAWARVATYASKGLTFNPSITGDNNLWYDGYKNVGGDWETWMRVNQRVVNLLDPSQPTTYPSAGSPPKPSTPDRRFDPTTRDGSSIGAPTADLVYIDYHIFNPARGRYHFSNVGHNRYGYHSVSAPDGGGLGVVPFFLQAENDLLWAEGLIRSGGSRTTAAQLINRTRVGRGGLTPLTGLEATAVGISGLANLSGTDNSDVLLRALYYERDIELMFSSGITPLYDARRTDRFTNYSVVASGDLVNTPRIFPVPAKELETLRKQIYTIKGNDSVAVGASLRVRRGQLGQEGSAATLQGIAVSPFLTLAPIEANSLVLEARRRERQAFKAGRQ